MESGQAGVIIWLAIGLHSVGVRCFHLQYLQAPLAVEEHIADLALRLALYPIGAVRLVDLVTAVAALDHNHTERLRHIGQFYIGAAIDSACPPAPYSSSRH